MANGRPIPLFDTAFSMYTSINGVRTDIIQVSGPLDFQQNFWEKFGFIVSDPVGRVLLYRLLIEILRTNDANNLDCYEDGSHTNAQREGIRSIEIRSANNGFSFDPFNR